MFVLYDNENTFFSSRTWFTGKPVTENQCRVFLFPMASHQVHLSVEIQCVFANIMLVSCTLWWFVYFLGTVWVLHPLLSTSYAEGTHKVWKKWTWIRKVPFKPKIKEKFCLYHYALHSEYNHTSKYKSLFYFIKINIFLKFLTTMFHILCNIWFNYGIVRVHYYYYYWKCYQMFTAGISKIWIHIVP